MRARILLGGFTLAVGLVVGVPSVASAGEVGKCLIETTEEATTAGAEAGDHAAEERLEKAVEKCQESPNPILPATNEIVWGVLSFAILLLVLWKVALPPITKTMQARSDRIRNDLMEAEAARAEAEAVQRRYEAQLGDARAEAQRILEEARHSADALKVDLARRADAEILETRRRAQADVEASKAQAIADLRSEVATLAIGAAEAVIEANLDPARQIQLIENYINQVGLAR